MGRLPVFFSDQAKQHRRASETDTVNHGGTFNREKVEPRYAQRQYSHGVSVLRTLTTRCRGCRNRRVYIDERRGNDAAKE